MKVAVVGATGLVGGEILKVLAERNFPISEIIPGMVYDHWYGLMAPGKTPPAIVAKISKDAGDVLNSPNVVKSLSSQGVTPAPTTPEQFNKFIAAEIKRLGDVVISANIPRQ
jgi:tripartite-type tricarboxylate transporter receptor subunit TctC